MKKIIIVTLASVSITLGAFAQGSVAGFNTVNSYITTPGANALNPNTATTFYYGPLSVEVFFSTTATAGDISTINSLNGVSSATAFGDLAGFGFEAVSLTGGVNSSVGFVTGAATSANNQIAGLPGTVDLSTLFAPSTAGDFAFLIEGGNGGSGSFANYASIEAITGNYGGQQVSPPLGTAFSVTSGLNALSGNNIVLTPLATPEPATMAMAALGGISLLALRRKK
jgi:hypothetical protein